MRILAVAENPDIHPYLQSLDASGQHHIVQYNHPLKALDNLPEIDPQIILWSNDDFPRHWKVCLTYVSDKNPPVRFYLMNEGKLSEDEDGKAKALGVEAVFTAGFFGEDVSDLFASLTPASTAETATGTANTAAYVAAKSEETNTQTSGSNMELAGAERLTMLSPKTAVIISALVLSANSREVLVEINNEKRISEFDMGNVIEHATFSGPGPAVQAVLRVAEKPKTSKLRLSLIELR